MQSQATVRLTEMAMQSTHFSHPNYRPDIDGLRAVAVLAVIAFHAFPEWIKGGFIGVDVFFVISGFLISTIIFGDLNKGSFSFFEFYARRIKRIFPALLIVLIFSYVCGWFILFDGDYRGLGKHIAAGSGFVSNFVLLREAGYFDDSAETKPLLHLWSLGIEEQFYILWPFLLWLSWRSRFNFFATTATAAVISFCLNIKGVGEDAVATFYSPQTRFWELLSGGMLAWFFTYKKDALSAYVLRVDGWSYKVTYRGAEKASGVTLSDIISFVGLLFLACGFFYISKSVKYPGVWAIVPVSGAIFIILAGPSAFVNRCILSRKVAVWFGLISFPLYLWHWPLLSFARIAEGEIPSVAMRVALLVLSVVLAWLTYRFIEQPIRAQGNVLIKVVSLGFICFLVGLLGALKATSFFESSEKTNIVQSQFKRWDYKTNSNCPSRFDPEKFYFLTFCIGNGKRGGVFLFGDSHANQLYPGLLEYIGDEYGLLSIGNGPPLKGVKVVFENGVFDHPWVDGWKSYDLVMKYLLENKEIKVVVISAMWDALLNGDFKNKNIAARVGSVKLVDEGGVDRDNASVVVSGLRKTIASLVANDKKIVLMIDTPELYIDPDSCIRYGFSSNCKMAIGNVLERQSLSRGMLRRLSLEFPGVTVFDPIKRICGEYWCYHRNGDKLVYRDYSHLSDYGSRMVGRDLSVVLKGLLKQN